MHSRNLYRKFVTLSLNVTVAEQQLVAEVLSGLLFALPAIIGILLITAKLYVAQTVFLGCRKLFKNLKFLD
jgi:hypothetical protein